MTPHTRALLGRLTASLPDRFDHVDILESLFKVETSIGGHSVFAISELGTDTVQIGDQLVTSGFADVDGSADGVFTFRWTKAPVADFADVSADTSSGPPPVEMSADDLFGRVPRPPAKASSPRGVF